MPEFSLLQMKLHSLAWMLLIETHVDRDTLYTKYCHDLVGKPLSFYAPLCPTSPRLQTYAQLAPSSYPYAQLIRFSLFLPFPFPPPYVLLPYHFCPAYIIFISIMVPKISLTFFNIFKIVCLYA
jgi:hypothetical protein